MSKGGAQVCRWLCKALIWQDHFQALSLSRLKHSSRYKMLQLMVKTHGAGLPLPAWLDSLVCYSVSLWVSLIYESTVQCVGSPAFMINLGNLDLPLHRASISSFRSQQLKLLNCGTFTQDLKKMLCYALTLAMSE